MCEVLRAHKFVTCQARDVTPHRFSMALFNMENGHHRALFPTRDNV